MHCPYHDMALQSLTKRNNFILNLRSEKKLIFWTIVYTVVHVTIEIIKNSLFPTNKLQLILWLSCVQIKIAYCVITITFLRRTTLFRNSASRRFCIKSNRQTFNAKKYCTLYCFIDVVSLLLVDPQSNNIQRMWYEIVILLTVRNMLRCISRA